MPLEVITDKGLDDLRDVREGVHVLGWDPKHGEIVQKLAKIQRIICNGSFYCINDRVLLYADQSVMIGEAAIHAKLLKVGDELTGLDGRPVPIYSIKKIVGKYAFYRTEVAGNHTYFLNGLLMHNASRFWVGGTGTWDASTTTNWAASTGGAGGSSAPTSADTATFDASSGTGTCTLSGAPACAGMDASASSVLTFTGTGTLTCAGDWALVSGLTITGWTGAITFTGTGAQKITTAANSLKMNMTINSNAGSYTLQDAFTQGSTNSITLTKGTFDTNGQTCSFGSISSNNLNTRTLTFGASNITFNGNTTNLSATTGPSTITFNLSSSTITISAGSGIQVGKTLTLGTLSITAGGSVSLSATGGLTVGTLTRTGTASTGAGIAFSSSITCTGTLTLNGNSTTNRLLVNSGTLGTAQTVSAATLVASYLDVQDITAAGAANWDISACTGLSGDCGGNTGITFTSPTTQHFTNVNGGNWNTAANWTSRVPLPQDDAIIDTAFGASKTLTIQQPRLGAAFDCSSATWTTAFTISLSNAVSVYGSFTLKSGITFTMGASDLALSGRGSHTFTSAGITFTGRINTTCGAGTYTQQDDITVSQNSSNAFETTSSGTWDANGHNITLTGASGGFLLGGGTTVKLGSGTWETQGTGGWNAGATIVDGGSTIKFSNSTATAMTFQGGNNSVYGTVWWARGASTGNITINTGSIYAVFKDTGTAAHSLIFQTGTTIVHTFGSFVATGSVGNLITVKSSSAGTGAKFRATCPFFAGANTTSVSGNTGVVFAAGYGNINCDWLSMQDIQMSQIQTFLGLHEVWV